MIVSAALALAASLVSVPDVTWEKLADPPKDVAGRESPPGTDGAWVYVPQWKGFLLYGGSSPTYSNEGWFFDPDRKEWTLLWPHVTAAAPTANRHERCRQQQTRYQKTNSHWTSSTGGERESWEQVTLLGT